MTWRNELQTLWEQVGDQRSAVDHTPDPLTPVILAALEAVRSELAEYGIRAYVEEHHFTQDGGKLSIVTPDARTIRLSVVARWALVALGLPHTARVSSRSARAA